MWRKNIHPHKKAVRQPVAHFPRLRETRGWRKSRCGLREEARTVFIETPRQIVRDVFKVHEFTGTAAVWLMLMQNLSVTPQTRSDAAVSRVWQSVEVGRQAFSQEICVG